MNFILLMGHSPTSKCRKLLFLPGRFVSPVPLIVVSRISQKPWNNISVDFAEKVVQAPKKKKITNLDLVQTALPYGHL